MTMTLISRVALVLVTSSLIVRSHTVVKDPDEELLRRAKRDRVDKRGFTSQEKKEVLKLHNRFRGEEQATDMTRMEWDYGLERMAQDWADQCIWTHNENRFSSDYRYIGENLYANTGVPSALDIVKDWNDERSYYNYNTQQCSKVCGHYTQIVWAKSQAVGCGVRYCRHITNLSWDRYGGGYVVVCNYGPGGNIIGNRPYTRGQPPCSVCPGTHPYCIEGLCSETKEIRDISAAVPVHQLRIDYLIVVMVIAFWMS